MINRDWHNTHRLVPRADLDQRVAWHIEHAKACGCRDMPESIKAEITKRGLELPERRK